MEKISNLMKKKFDSKPVCRDEFIKTKIKSYGDTKNTNFQGKQKYQKKIHNTHVCLWCY